MEILSAPDRTQILAEIERQLSKILLPRATPLLSDSTQATDIPGWDSLNHLKLLVALEARYKIRFDIGDLEDLNNMGELIDLVGRKTTPV
jgi:acyl carrier protein